MTSMRQKSDGPSNARPTEAAWASAAPSRETAASAAAGEASRDVDFRIRVVVTATAVLVAMVVVAVVEVAVLEVVVAVVDVCVAVVVFGGEGRSRIQARMSALEAPKRAQTSDCNSQPVPGR
mmetsp:Transcript_74061/g.194268  ORF Transcript_74061/g.194268 Transcript_74061/m.194268 type:complete len:122 (-) Transcript_74061:90-455(-)